jgi:hypothetical protein|eukprot:COSAG03_NODE_15_length_22165_cov_72.809934_10_plen_146_part_00
MTITDIIPYPTWQGHRNIMLVKVECEGGLYGWGEAGLSGRELAVSGAVDHYKQFLIGQDGMRISALWQEMYRSQYFEGGRALTAAISAIDIGVPHQLFLPCHSFPHTKLKSPCAEQRYTTASARNSGFRFTSSSAAPIDITFLAW